MEMEIQSTKVMHSEVTGYVTYALRRLEVSIQCPDHRPMFSPLQCVTTYRSFQWLCYKRSLVCMSLLCLVEHLNRGPEWHFMKPNFFFFEPKTLLESLAPTPTESDIVDLGWEPDICISTHFSWFCYTTFWEILLKGNGFLASEVH